MVRHVGDTYASIFETSLFEFIFVDLVDTTKIVYFYEIFQHFLCVFLLVFSVSDKVLEKLAYESDLDVVKSVESTSLFVSTDKQLLKGSNYQSPESNNFFNKVDLGKRHKYL